MESIQGKQSRHFEPALLADRLAGYDSLLVDIGTGDGRFVKDFAETHPESFAIGIDTCRENLYAVSRRRRPNALFLICPAGALPGELFGRASMITINFPWGSLLRGLLEPDPALFSGLAAVARLGTRLELRVNSGGLQESGLTLEAACGQIASALTHSGYEVCSSSLLGSRELRACGTTWAKRLAFGRDPHALQICARRA